MLGALIGIGSALGSLFGKGASASADARAKEAALNVARDRNALDAYQTGQNAQFQQGNLDLQRKGFSEDARGNRARQALIGDLIARFAPTQINVPGIQQANVTGGLSVGPEGKQAMANLVKQALMAQMTPDTFQGGNILQAPKQTPIPQAGTLEKILGIGGLIGSGIGAVGPHLEDIFRRPPTDPYEVEKTQ